MTSTKDLTSDNLTRAAQNVIYQWVRGHLPECAIFTVAMLLRFTMTWRYQAQWGYDAAPHWAYVEWILQHGSLPPLADMLQAFHPPLYYATAAALVKLGATHQGVIWLSIACGGLRLALIWYGLELYVRQRRARIAALALAAVLPVSVHVDGMAYHEAMNGMFGAAAMLLWLAAFRATGRRRWRFACALGLALGLGLLTKVSTLVLLLTLGVGVSLDLLLPSKPIDWRGWPKALAPWAATVAICLAVAGWFYARNVTQYRKPILTSFDTTQAWVVSRSSRLPYLKRRSPSFIFAWDLAIYRRPYDPVGLEPHPRFFPVAVATTFLDYYNFSFSGLDPKLQVEANLQVLGLTLTPRLMWLSRGAMLGGTIILIGTVAAWAVCLRRTWRDWGLFTTLLAPLLTTLFTLHFAVKYPHDDYGVVKGAYMLFGAAPLYAMFGLAVAWASSQRWRWPMLAVLLLGLGAVAAYTVCCRTGLFL